LWAVFFRDIELNLCNLKTIEAEGTKRAIFIVTHAFKGFLINPKLQ